MKKFFSKYLALFSCFLLLSGCGFHLRGYQSISPQLHHLVIQAPNPYDPFVVQLKQILVSSGVIITDAPKSAPLTLTILGIEFHQQVVNISANTQVKTYNLQYRVTFALVNNQDKVIYGPKTVVATSSYASDANQILGDNSVLTMQKQNMRRQAISQLLNRLNSTEARRAEAGIQN